MGKNNWPRFRSPHTLDYAASSIGCFRNQPRHGESIQRRRKKLPVADGLNLRCARQQNERLKLLLNLTNRITSNLRPRELLREIAASIREVVHCDVVAVSLLDAESWKSRLYALDFPQGKGFIREEHVHTITGPSKRVLETLKPVIVERF